MPSLDQSQLGRYQACYLMIPLFDILGHQHAERVLGIETATTALFVVFRYVKKGQLRKGYLKGTLVETHRTIAGKHGNTPRG